MGSSRDIPEILPSEEHLAWDVKELLRLEYRGGPVTSPPLPRLRPAKPDATVKPEPVRKSLRDIELFVTSIDYAASLTLAGAGTVDFDRGTCEPARLEEIVEVVKAWKGFAFEGLDCAETSNGTERFLARELNVGERFRAWSAILAKADDDDPSIEWVVSIRALEKVNAASSTLVVVRLGRSSTGGVIKPFSTPAAPPRVIRDLLCPSESLLSTVESP